MPQWIDFVWMAMAAASAVLAALHLMIWVRQPRLAAHGMFAVFSIPVAFVAVLELAMMQEKSAATYADLLRLMHIAFVPSAIGLVVFVRLYCQSGRLWLAIVACAARLAAAVANLATGVNLNYLTITDLVQVPVWGGGFVIAPVGVTNPWMLLGHVSNFAMLAFLADALLSVARRPASAERTQRIRVTGSLFGFIALATIWHSFVVFSGGIAPVMFAPQFLCVLLAMSYELGGDVLRAVQLAGALQTSESHLRDSEQTMRLAVRATGLGMWSWDARNDELWVSDYAQRLLGIPQHTSFNRNELRERIAPADRMKLRDEMQRAVADPGTDFNLDFQISTAERGNRWISAHGKVEANADQSMRVHGVVVDITERKRTDERFRLAVGALPAAILLLDSAGVVVLANRAAADLTGYPIEDLVGKSADALVFGESREAHEGLRDGHAATPLDRVMSANRDVLLRRADGTPLPVEVALSPVDADVGRLTIAAITDLSERHAKNKEIAAQRDALAHMSRVGLLSELSGSLAHELNQPLAAILSNAQASLRFLKHDPPNIDEVREGLVNIVDSDKRAGEVIRRLRAMLRREAPTFVRLDLNGVVHEVMRIIRSDLIERNVRIVEDLTPGLPMILGDRVQLQQVILNLLINGSDAMRELDKGRQLTLKSELADGGVQLHVADVGHGIPEADLERVFAPFVSTKADGMGIGLALCTTLIQAHSGRLWATNNVDRGATLHVHLPIADSP